MILYSENNGGNMSQISSFKQDLSKVITIVLFFSSLLYPQSNGLNKLISDSKVIVVGSVKNIQCKWDKEKKNIWTFVTIDTEQFIKGKKEGGELTIRIPGGVVGDIGERVSGTPEYKVGEYVLSFLAEDIDDFFYVNGWQEGKYVFKGGNWIGNSNEYPEQFLNDIKLIIHKQQ